MHFSLPSHFLFLQVQLRYILKIHTFFFPTTQSSFVRYSFPSFHLSLFSRLFFSMCYLRWFFTDRIHSVFLLLPRPLHFLHLNFNRSSSHSFGFSSSALSFFHLIIIIIGSGRSSCIFQWTSTKTIRITKSNLPPSSPKHIPSPSTHKFFNSVTEFFFFFFSERMVTSFGWIWVKTSLSRRRWIDYLVIRKEWKVWSIDIFFFYSRCTNDLGQLHSSRNKGNNQSAWRWRWREWKWRIVGLESVYQRNSCCISSQLCF